TTTLEYNTTYTAAITTGVKDLAGNVLEAGYTWSFTTKEILAGDINDDGDVNLTDAILALQILSGAEPASSVYAEADVDRDDKIGMAEVIYILQKVSGMRD
ncbi:MAG: Ig-like domain-containing protein, partial [Thermodesulfobacteriota bacterium]|nr:Ig-like domain-containing protein [Thermodesulfobacteriota bacterium]